MSNATLKREILDQVSLLIDRALAATDDAPEPVEFLTATEAVEKYPTIYKSLSAVRWKLRARESNGLLTSGAVVEPVGGRMLFEHTKYLEWMRGAAA